MKPSPPCCGPTRDAVRSAYGELAESEDRGSSDAVARALGYDDADIDAFDDANLGVGCGNPVAHALLSPGDRVLDLGSGAGFDALVARRVVGDEGYVIGVDMTRSMLERARANAAKIGVSANVEFREGVIEALPVIDDSVDVVMSNCVINLCDDKATVFREAYRVLRPGGRLAVSDILLTEPLPEAVAANVTALVGCVAGAALVGDYQRYLTEAGFHDVTLTRKAGGESCFAEYQDPLARALRDELDPKLLERALACVGSYTVTATK